MAVSPTTPCSLRCYVDEKAAVRAVGAAEMAKTTLS